MTAGKKRLRSGYTTGACAAAAAKGAALCLLGGREVVEVSIPFPDHSRVNFAMHCCRLQGDRALASVIKDAGDDPDVTNGAEIIAEVVLLSAAGKIPKESLIIQGGAGVGMVTKPGLPVSIGRPAINPVPEKMIRMAIDEARASINNKQPLSVTISVAHGKYLAEKTLNRRLGIIGGLSILGTTGIVKPVSAEAWTATIETSMNVAKETGLREIVLSTGRTSEKAVQQLLDLPEEAYAMMGDYLGFSLIKAKETGFVKIHLAVMWAKVMKAAMEIPQTHVRHGALEPVQALDYLKKTGIVSDEVAGRLDHANTVREIYDRLHKLGREDIIKMVCLAAKRYAEKTSGLPVSVYLVTSAKKVAVRV